MWNNPLPAPLIFPAHPVCPGRYTNGRCHYQTLDMVEERKREYRANGISYYVRGFS